MKILSKKKKKTHTQFKENLILPRIRTYILKRNTNYKLNLFQNILLHLFNKASIPIIFKSEFFTRTISQEFDFILLTNYAVGF